MKVFAVLPLLAAAVSAQIVNLNARDGAQGTIKTIDNKVTSKGLCSGNAKGEFSYSPENPEEVLSFTIDLVSKENPVKLTAYYVNEATGEKTEAVISKDNSPHSVGGSAKKGDKVKLTVQPEGASNDACEYSVSLDAKGPAGEPCPTQGPATTVYETATATKTVPGTAPTGADVCLCKCGTEGAKPLPNIEL